MFLFCLENYKKKLVNKLYPFHFYVLINANEQCYIEQCIILYLTWTQLLCNLVFIKNIKRL